MNQQDFNELVNKRLDFCKEVLTVKGAEYTRKNDTLHVFNSSAKRRGTTPLEALDGMLEKHLQSFYDIIEDVRDGKIISQKILDDKIGDILNYFILAEAIVVEHNNKKTPIVTDTVSWRITEPPDAKGYYTVPESKSIPKEFWGMKTESPDFSWQELNKHNHE